MTDDTLIPDLAYLKAWIVACNESNPKAANWLGGVLSARSLALIEYEKALNVCLRDAGLKP